MGLDWRVSTSKRFAPKQKRSMSPMNGVDRRIVWESMSPGFRVPKRRMDSHVPNMPSTCQWLCCGIKKTCSIRSRFLSFESTARSSGAVQNRRIGVPLGDTLYGKRVLIIGFGGIALSLIPRLKPFQASSVRLLLFEDPPPRRFP